MRQFGISNISGRHGKMFAKWRLPKKFIDDKGHLRTLLGEELYATYCKLKEGEHVSFTDLKRGDSGPTRAEVALRIFQSLAALPEKDIKELGIGSKNCGTMMRILRMSQIMGMMMRYLILSLRSN